MAPDTPVSKDASDTPRTDAEMFDSTLFGACSIVKVDLARKLERELAASAQTVLDLCRELTELRASLIREQNAVKVLARENDRLRIALNVACGENEG